jgi:hypothetical protein
MRFIFTAILLLLSASLSKNLQAQWTMNADLAGHGIVSIAVHDSILYVGTADSVYCSSDSGAHWVPLSGSPKQVCAIAFQGSCIFTGSRAGTPAYGMRSSDNGVSWEPMDNGTQTPISCLAMSGSTVLRGCPAMGGGKYLFRSNDSGRTWTPAVVGMGAVLTFGFRGDNVLAGTQYDGVASSQDSGLTWTKYYAGLPYTPLACREIHALGTVDTTLFAGVIDAGVFRSTDGKTWEGVNSGLGHGKVTAFAVSDSNLFAATAGGGIYLSANKGQSWIAVNEGLEELSVQSLAVYEGYLFAGTITGLWMRPVSEMVQNQDLFEVFPLYVGMGSRYSFAAHNKWNNSTTHTYGNTNDSGEVQIMVLDSLHSSDSLRVWTIQQKSHLLHWEETYDNSGLIDEKSNWSDNTSTFLLNENLTGFHEIQGRGKIWDFPLSGRRGTHRVYRYDFDTVSTVGMPGIEDQWIFNQQRGLVSRNYHATGIFNPTGDTTISIRMLGTLTGVGDELAPALAGEFKLLGNYPNPFNPFTVIKYTVGGVRGQGLGARDISLIVYDILGRKVATLVNEPVALGSYEVRFDGSKLASGVYIYRLTAGSFVQAKTMVLLK